MTTPKIQTVKPDGDDGPRFYVFEGTEHPVPGVTSVVGMKHKHGLEAWAANEAAEFAVRATRNDTPVFELQTDPHDTGMFAASVLLTWRQLCEQRPDMAYKLCANARKAKNRAAIDKGNAAHDTIERVAFLSLDQLRAVYKDALFDSQGPYAEYSLEPWALRAWGQFVARFNVRVLHSEVTLYSHNGHMGTCDLIVEMDTPWLDIERGVVLLDTKTGKGIYPEVAKQLAAYRFSDWIISSEDDKINYWGVPHINSCAVFWPREHADKNGDYYALREVIAEREDYEAFLSLLTVMEWDQGRKKGALGKAIVGNKTRPRAAIDWTTP
jgi:hypothetical protein